MVKRCPECGAESPDDAAGCARCGAEFVGEVEIEVYDVASLVEEKPGYFEEALAAARETVKKDSHEPAADLADDPRIWEELKSGYEIRKRRLGHRAPRSRNVVIIVVAGAALLLAVVYGVRWAVGRMPKYEYAEPAHAAPTDLALELAAELEAARVELAAAAPATPVLAVGGEGGKILVDGHYVADAPATGILVPPGRHHVVVKNGNALTLDETIDFKPREKYALEPKAAAALAAPR